MAPYAAPTKGLPCYSYPAIVTDLFDKLIELLCKQGWWEWADRAMTKNRLQQQPFSQMAEWECIIYWPGQIEILQ